MLSASSLSKIGFAADALLFLSGLLLVDLSPRDFMPRFTGQKAALARLREYHNLMLPPVTRIVRALMVVIGLV